MTAILRPLLSSQRPNASGDTADLDGGPIADEPQSRQRKRRGSNQKGDEANDTLGAVYEPPLVLIRKNRAEAALDDAGHEVRHHVCRDERQRERQRQFRPLVHEVAR